MAEFEYKYDDLLNPVLQALHKLNGSGTTGEIDEKLFEWLVKSGDSVKHKTPDFQMLQESDTRALNEGVPDCKTFRCNQTHLF